MKPEWYLIGINAAAFFLFYYDKQCAIHNRWRIPEKQLLLSAFAGGGLGALLGMYLFHHKTRKWKFRIFVPLSILIWAFAFDYLGVLIP